jgi:hypothetical protein
MKNLESIQDYKNHTIKIYYDEGNINPFEEWDGIADLAYKGGRHGSSGNYGQDPGNYVSSQITSGQIIYNQKALCEILQLDIQYFKDYSFSSDDKVNDIISHIEDAEFSQLSEICEIFKIPHVHETQSYSQSEWAEVFTFCSYEFIKRTGVEPKNRQGAAEGAAELFQQWGSGEVYSYTTEDNNGEQLDSCSGYYGDDHEKSGLMEQAKDSINYHIASTRKAKFKKLKELIRAKVPYIYRVPQLTEFNI